MAASRRQELNIPIDVAAALGRSAVKASRNGFYVTKDGQEIVWRDAVQAACGAKRSIALTLRCLVVSAAPSWKHGFRSRMKQRSERRDASLSTGSGRLL
jgi:hypothetical protein